MGFLHRLGFVVCAFAAVPAAAPSTYQARSAPDRGPLALVERSNDVAWLERIAASGEFAREVQGRSFIGMPKALRVAAYARLGTIATPESLAAIERVEQAMTTRSLTPDTLPLDSWPAVAPHMSDTRAEPIASAAPKNGITYAVVPATLFGGYDYFLVASRTPSDPTSWSRPKLIGPARLDADSRTATLTWGGPRIAILHLSGGELQIAIDEVERDSDGDGWTDVEEARLGTNPHDPDTDGDGIVDGRDVCPLYAAPAGEAAAEETVVLQKAVFAAFAITGSRQLLYVTPGTPRFHVAGYGGPILFDRAIPKDGSGGAVFVGWKITSRTADSAAVQVTDWEGNLAAGGQDVALRKIAGTWVVVSVRMSWVS